MTAQTIAERVRDIAVALGHAGALSNAQLIESRTLTAFVETFDANVAVECARIRAQHGEGSGWMSPRAAWTLLERLGADGGGHSAVCTTGSGRLTITATVPGDATVAGFGWRITLEFEAGPLPGQQDGRPVLTIVWQDDAAVARVEYLDSELLAEKPARLDLLSRVARAAGLRVPDQLTAAISMASAHALAIETLRAESARVLQSVPLTRAATDWDEIAGLAWSPDDFAPALP